MSNDRDKFYSEVGKAAKLRRAFQATVERLALMLDKGQDITPQLDQQDRRAIKRWRNAAKAMKLTGLKDKLDDYLEDRKYRKY